QRAANCNHAEDRRGHYCQYRLFSVAARSKLPGAPNSFSQIMREEGERSIELTEFQRNQGGAGKMSGKFVTEMVFLPCEPLARAGARTSQFRMDRMAGRGDYDMNSLRERLTSVGRALP